jgi:GDSL-like lipase/acylhydrolase family protein
MVKLKRGAVALVAGVALVVVGLGTSAPAQASGPHSGNDKRPSAVVALGDSYISGEAGRWKGNTADSSPGRLGTDRAWRADPSDPANPAGVIDRSLVYGDTAANGCHRSDVSEVVSARLPVRKVINLACSGARTVNVLRASAGGVAFKGEEPQNDQLAEVARANKVKLIVVSIGGNDLGFGSILTSCVGAYLSAGTPCSSTLPPTIDAGLPKMAAAVTATLDDVRATMSEAGYNQADYRLVLQSYPSPLPAAGKNRYSGTAADPRASVGGCPFQDVDSAWAKSSLIPALSSALGAAAKKGGAQFLDLSDAFSGHELCASAAKQSTGTPRGANSEWIRFVDLAGQGDVAESLHPNYFGQKALGRCLALITFTHKDVACHSVAGLPTWVVYPTKVK